MDVNTTQERILASLPRMLERTGTGSWTVRGDLNTARPTSVPRQHTESFRTRMSSPDALSASEVRDFLTVTYNGLREANPTYDTGHPFFTTKTWTSFSQPSWKMYKINVDGTRTYLKTPLVPLNNSSDSSKDVGYHPGIPRLSSSDIGRYGAAAIKNCQPTKSAASLGQFLGELIQEVPRMIGISLLESRSDFYRSLGSEYLNVEFGWNPFISDLKKLCKAVSDSNEIVRQYVRDSGRVVRRRYSFPTEVSGSTSSNIKRPGTGVWGVDNTWFQKVASSVYMENVKTRDIWFSGAFMYYLNPGNEIMDRLDRYSAEADKLFGLSITPSLLWELTPWSWLMDWWANIGDILANASSMSANGLVMKYGYLMCHTREFNRFTCLEGVTFKPDLKTGPFHSIFGRETKERVKASPYGFGIDPSSFSAWQWSILGALGLTRAPGILH